MQEKNLKLQTEFKRSDFNVWLENNLTFLKSREKFDVLEIKENTIGFNNLFRSMALAYRLKNPSGNSFQPID
jgi:hypothetical protein